MEEDGTALGEYVYNGLGQRVKKTVDGVDTVYHWDFDDNIIAESDAAGTFAKEYLYRHSGRLAMVDVSSGEFYFYLNDNLGTPQMLTDNTGMVVWEGIYRPFGEADVNPNSTVENNFRFAGQYYDEETGWHYNYHRYYDPATGRYLTSDPIGLAGGINLYLYAAANPTNLNDPYGLTTIPYPQYGPIGIDPGFHPVFQPGTYQNQLIANDLMKLVRLMDPRQLLRDIFDGPDDPTSIEDWERWAKKRDQKISDETMCEERTPWPGPSGGYDPDDPPPPNNNDPLWKKIARIILDTLRIGTNQP